MRIRDFFVEPFRDTDMRVWGVEGRLGRSADDLSPERLQYVNLHWQRLETFGTQQIRCDNNLFLTHLLWQRNDDPVALDGGS